MHPQIYEQHHAPCTDKERGAFIEINNPKLYFIASLLPSPGMRLYSDDGNPQPLPLPLRRKSITLFFMCH